mmetsp:Transcript_50171/g.122425  ORF Transcript_50171/g.122425 Transcript_50171/m.122425 type:complete len:273 (+) Transcript_50171:159-977(+)|eukprot:CAMPEP_0206230926 /NCGR_PEP_ID=MMETSP0047_2-20121206/10547_1 /ASSEMBLY_ACC=CAM_ASM_000192 /TAXON_ID=195065 /ORGANISM="Chroomonas mesostigmatica_cf, Strain CCMP1168" /LENGTH=272 /DNA_ID=CAMNT_0053654437 /DNA_START=158 /DNA_END=976 /DNA_ORIENTATION=+
MGGGVLGETVKSPEEYCPGVLEGIARNMGRQFLDPPIVEGSTLPFQGEDVWNCYEVSWLDTKGAPKHGILEMRVPCTTPRLVESKSLKLYLNSLNFHRFETEKALFSTISKDVGDVIGGGIGLKLLQGEPPLIDSDKWACIDDEDVEMTTFEENEDFLLCESDAVVEERLVCHLLRTNCPVTNQPDWGSLLLHYRGPKVDRKGLKKYLCSLRKEVGFHETCSEKVFLALTKKCAPAMLNVTMRYMRRGGIDINPTRTTESDWDHEQIRVLGQ